MDNTERSGRAFTDLMSVLDEKIWPLGTHWPKPSSRAMRGVGPARPGALIRVAPQVADRSLLLDRCDPGAVGLDAASDVDLAHGAPWLDAEDGGQRSGSWTGRMQVYRDLSQCMHDFLGGGGARIRTGGWGFCRPLPCLLATPP